MPNNQPAAAAAGAGGGGGGGETKRARSALWRTVERACSNKSFARHGAGSQREEVAAAWHCELKLPVSGQSMAISFQVQKCRKWQETTSEKVTGVPQQLWVEQIRRQIATKSPRTTRPNTQDSQRSQRPNPSPGKLCSAARMRQLLTEVKDATLGRQCRGTGVRCSGCRDYNLDTGKQ